MEVVPSPLLIATDQGVANSIALKWNNTKYAIQYVLALYDHIEVIEPLTGEEFGILFTDPLRVLYSKFFQGDAYIANENDNRVQIDRAKALDLMQKPDGYNEFLDGLQSCLKDLSNPDNKGQYILQRKDGKSIANNFYLDIDTGLQFAPAVQNAINEAGKKYLLTENGQAQYQFLLDVVAAFYSNNLHVYYPHPDKAIYETLRSLELAIRELDYENQSFIQNSHTERIIKAFDEPLRICGNW